MPEDEGVPSGGEPQPVAALAQVKQAYRLLTNEALLSFTTPDVAPYEYDTFDAWSGH